MTWAPWLEQRNRVEATAVAASAHDFADGPRVELDTAVIPVTVPEGITFADGDLLLIRRVGSTWRVDAVMARADTQNTTGVAPSGGTPKPL